MVDKKKLYLQLFNKYSFSFYPGHEEQSKDFIRTISQHSAQFQSFVLINKYISFFFKNRYSSHPSFALKKLHKNITIHYNSIVKFIVRSRPHGGSSENKTVRYNRGLCCSAQIMGHERKNAPLLPVIQQEGRARSPVNS